MRLIRKLVFVGLATAAVKYFFDENEGRARREQVIQGVNGVMAKAKNAETSRG